NNSDGHDYKILKSFGEPSWNNPVVRIMTHDRKELVPRLSGDYSKLGLVTAMIKALKNDNQIVPPYLRLLEEELRAKVNGSERAVFAMHCFWSGEEALGSIDGVISTKPGFMKGYEVVEVEYDPNVISYNKLLEKAKNERVANHIFVKDGVQKNIAEKVVGKSSVSDLSNFRPDTDPKHYLSQTIYEYVPMTALQASRVNSAIGSGKPPDDFLSPRQLDLFKFIKNHPELDWQNSINASDFPTAWNLAINLVDTKVSMK
ncbi:peptide-methionine (S)-S-oxide reductase, partial [Desulfobacterota bacterium AH_259_B03_O07]|nr:peptide-methionine (S)-S-oxide reductase [Desulfobacterota bacterium AH_259_B03_O07]